MKIIAHAEFKRMPWKNGGGFTFEIARSGEGDTFAWRLSVAEVNASGPFSLFQGYQRILTVISGAGMRLQGPLNSYEAKLLTPVAFSGDETVNGLLNEGPCRDFNVIYDPRQIAAEVHIIHGSQIVRASQMRHAIKGVLLIAAGSPQSQNMNAGDFAVLDQPSDQLSLGSNASALVVELLASHHAG